MIVNFNEKIYTPTGQPYMHSETKELTLSLLCIDAIMVPDANEKSGEKKIRRYEVAKKILGAGEVDLAAEDVADLKTILAVGYNPIVYGQACELLEGKPNALKPTE